MLTSLSHARHIYPPSRKKREMVRRMHTADTLALIPFFFPLQEEEGEGAEGQQPSRLLMSADEMLD